MTEFLICAVCALCIVQWPSETALPQKRRKNEELDNDWRYFRNAKKSGPDQWSKKVGTLIIYVWVAFLPRTKQCCLICSVPVCHSTNALIVFYANEYLICLNSPAFFSRQNISLEFLSLRAYVRRVILLGALWDRDSKSEKTAKPNVASQRENRRVLLSLRLLRWCCCCSVVIVVVVYFVLPFLFITHTFISFHSGIFAIPIVRCSLNDTSV